MKYIRLRVLLFFTLISLLIFVAASLWQHNLKQDELYHEKTTIEGQINDIIYLDEVRSASAYMAAFTGDLGWQQRYDSHVIRLDDVFRSISRLGPDAEEWVQKIAASNKILVGMEDQAFKAIRAGKPNKARSILLSLKYTNEKKKYIILSQQFKRKSLDLAHQFILQQELGLTDSKSGFRALFTFQNIALYGLASILLSGLFYFTYQKIPNSKKLTEIEHLSVERLRFLGLSFLSFLVVFVTAVSIAMVEQNRTRELEQQKTTLETVLKTTEEGLVIWVESKKKFLLEFANNRNLSILVEGLLQVPKTKQRLQEAKLQQKIRAYIQGHQMSFGNVGFFLINKDEISIGSMRNQNLGTKNLIAKQRPDLLQRAFAGESIFVPPIHSDVLIDFVDTVTIPTMFLLVPIWDQQHSKVIALLAQRLRPENQFTKMLQLGRVGESGESYAFDQNALLLTNSRFDAQLQRQGLLAGNDTGILNIEIRDHSQPILDPVTKKRTYPLTLMAASALQGESGSNMEGYADYRGVPVFGAWTWNKTLGIGLTTEIDVAEGLKAFHAIQWTLYSLVTGLLLITIAGVFLLLYLSARSAKVLTEANEELETRVILRTSELEISMLKAQEAVKVKSDFLANMSHEIRTPMNAVLGFLSISLESHNLPNDLRKHLQTAHQSANNLLVIINDILDISKLEAGKIEIEHHCFNFRRTLVDVICTLEQAAESKGLYLTMKYAEEIPLCTVGDAHRLRQVLMNILGNAIKFTDNGGITLNLDWSDASKSSLHLQVIDTGIGMTELQVEKVFDAFTQADGSTARKFGGTGLGTTISRQLVEAMGGKIWATSVEEEGSTFHISLPFTAPSCEKSCDAFDEPTVELISRSPRTFHVLLAEDIIENATLVDIRLKQQGHTMVWVKDGAEAVAMFQTEDFDLILMDVQMPKMDGMEATRKIRELEKEGEHIPVIALTASVLENDRKYCFAAGMDAIVGKPIDVDELLNAMENAVPEGKGTTQDVTLFEGSQSLLAKDMEYDQLKDLSVQQKIEGLADVPKAMRAWRDMDVYISSITSFIKERRDNAQLIQERLEAGDFQAAKVISHTIKGVIGNFQFTKAFSLAEKIDNCLAEQKKEEAVQLLPDLDQALLEIFQAVSTPSLEVQASIGPVDIEAALPLFAKLNISLEKDNPDVALPIVQEIEALIGENALSQVKDAISRFDFEAAKSQVESLMAQKQGGGKKMV